MRVTYDPRYNIAYIRFHEKSTEVENIRISDELNYVYEIIWLNDCHDKRMLWGSFIIFISKKSNKTFFFKYALPIM